MDQSRFVLLTRSFIVTPSRRDIWRGLAGAGLGALTLPTLANAKKKKRKRKKKHKKRTPKATPNEFGCLEVDDPCTSADDCCSGICEGKKCRAHDVGTCDQKRPAYCAVENPELAACKGGDGIDGICVRTTAGSNVCINSMVCADCRRDADCLALGYPPGSACVPVGGELACEGLCPETGTACVHLGPED